MIDLYGFENLDYERSKQKILSSRKDSGFCSVFSTERTVLYTLGDDGDMMGDLF